MNMRTGISANTPQTTLFTMKILAITLLLTGSMLGIAVAQNIPPTAEQLQRSTQDLADQIQRQVENQIRNAAGAAFGPSHAFPGNDNGLPQPGFHQMHWNLFHRQLLRIPEVLRPAHPTLADGSGLIVGWRLVDADGAEHLSRGAILLRQDGRMLRTPDDFVVPTVPTVLDLLGPDGQLTTLRIDPATVSPDHSALAFGMPLAVPHHGLNRAGVWPPNPSGSGSLATSRHSAESISVANTNGEIQIRGNLQIHGEPVPIDLQGTAAEVDAQIEKLPAEVRAKLRNQVRY